MNKTQQQMNNKEPEKKNVWVEFDKIFLNQGEYGIQAKGLELAIKSFIKTHFIPRAEVVEKIEEASVLEVKYVPTRTNEAPEIYIKKDDLLTLLTQ